MDVNGPHASPLYKAMKEVIGGGDVKWNFEKFLIDRQGLVVRRYRSKVQPDLIASDIEKVLDGKALRMAVIESEDDI